MRRSLALLLGVAALLAGAWGVAEFLGAAPSASRAAQPVRTPRATAPAPAAAAPLDLERDRGRADSPVATGEGARAEVGSAPPSEALVVQVVQVTDALAREPLPDARVAFAVVERDLDLDGHPGWRPDTCDAWFAEHGTEVRAGPDGRAELRAPAGSLLLVAGWAPDRFGRDRIDVQAQSTARLALQPDTTLEVLAVDALGAPLPGAIVALKRMQNTWGGNAEHSRTCDAEGRALYPHVGLTVDLAQEAWAVVAPTLLGRVEPVELDPRALPRGPVRLAFPATGSVEVRVTDAPGMPPIGDQAEVALLVDEGRSDELLSFWTRPESVSQRVVGGVARFELVPLGLDLIAEAKPDGGQVSTRVRGRGPDVAGQTATLAVTLGGDHPVLRLRLLDGDGAPLAARELEVRLDGSGFATEQTLRSDDLGRLHLDVTKSEDPADVRTLAISLAATAEAPAARAHTTLPTELRPGIHDLGDLTLVPDRPLLSGRVVLPDGVDPASVSFLVAALRDYGGDRTWIEELPAVGRCAPDGAFVVHGADPGTQMRVAAQCDGYGSAPIDCAAGATGIVLELVAAGSVAGRVLLDEDVDPTLLNVHLDPGDAGDSVDYRRRRQVELAADGTFRVEGLAAGAWTLDLRDSTGGEAVVRLERIEVPSGAPSSDPRLAEIDLRGRLAVVRLTLVPPRPTDLVMGVLIYRPAGSERGGEGQSTSFLHDTRVVLCVAGRSADISVRVNGFRAVELAAARGDVTVELERGPAVRLKLPPGTELPKPPRFLKPFLVAEESDESSMGGHFQSQVFDASGEVLLHAPGHGRLRVDWLIEERSPNSLSTSSLEVPEPQWIEVLDVAAEQVFEVVVPDFEH